LFRWTTFRLPAPTQMGNGSRWQGQRAVGALAVDGRGIVAPSLDALGEGRMSRTLLKFGGGPGAQPLRRW
jgi:hypothetical protein